MRLDIEDFAEVLSVKNKIQEETKEDIERKYIEEIQRLKKEFKETLEQEIKKAYESGFKEGYERANNELKREYQKQIEEIYKEKEEELLSVLNNLKGFENKLREKFENYLSSTRELIVDSVDEILELLYIDKNSKDSIVKAIDSIITEFKESKEIEVVVGKQLYELLKDNFPNVKLDPSLEENDFVVSFGDFQIENRLKEKLKIIKDEIKREIKKLT